MSIVHLNQIQSYLVKTFDNLIDLSDYKNKSEQEKQIAFLSRSLAAFSLIGLVDIEPVKAADAVIDGGQDNGIDAIYFDKQQKILYLVQSKWSQQGTKTIEKGDIQKFIQGVKDLLYASFERFNKIKIQDKLSDIQEAIYDAETRFMLVIAYTGNQGLADEPLRDIQDFLKEINDVSNIMSYTILRQSEIYKIISTGLNSPIDLDIMLYNWSQTREPYQAFFGQVSAKDVAQWWNDYFHRLFEPNIRAFLGNTEANDGIIETLDKEPQNFWYYNNGITALCSSINKKPIGGNSRETATFECKNLSIVNGAQTVGSIAKANDLFPSHLEQARVLIRLISLENCPEGFSTEVTKFNNTQNKIDRRDFIALDPEQERIKNELKLEGIEYIYKSGESLNQGLQGFNLDEATVALACRNTDISLTVRSKDKIGTLWNDINKAPYKTLFNSSVHGKYIWRLVEIKRIVEETLLIEKSTDEPKRRKLYATHGNRLILHLLYTKLEKEFYNLFNGLTEDNTSVIEDTTRILLDNVFTQADLLFPESYPANICKNVNKCTRIKKEILEL
jgi:hypothetical protein